LNKQYNGWCSLGDLAHSHRDKDLEKRWREDIVLPIDASIPFPPPSGSVCRPSASSMIASRASPAKPNQTISKRGQTVHDMLHIEQIIMGAVVLMPNFHKLQHFMQCTRKHMKTN